MSTGERRCQGTNAEGEPCSSPMVGDDGWCPAHRPGGRSEMRRRGTKGAYKSHEGKGLDEDELGPLEDHADAKAWLEVVGRAVATGRLSHRQGNVVVRAVREWVQAHGDELTAEVVEKLRAKIEALEEELGESWR